MGELAPCGVLFDVFALAEQYEVDLDAQYGDQLAQLAARWASRDQRRRR